MARETYVPQQKFVVDTSEVSKVYMIHLCQKKSQS